MKETVTADKPESIRKCVGKSGGIKRLKQNKDYSS